MFTDMHGGWGKQLEIIYMYRLYMHIYIYTRIHIYVYIYIYIYIYISQLARGGESGSPNFPKFKLVSHFNG